MSSGDREAWFEISNDGWRIQNLGRPLASLVYEGVQNAMDQPEVRRVTVHLDEQRIVIEDDGPHGFADPKLAYTVFLTDKGDSAVMRGRHGRGLKELVSAMDHAVIETVGFTLTFGPQGRQLSPTGRRRGTRLVLSRETTPLEIEQAVAMLSMLIPPKGIAVVINGHPVERPRRFAVLTGCKLDTVLTSQGVERVLQRVTTVTLLYPRSGDERPYLFEMGLPVQPLGTPWHVDVGQRIPLEERRDRVADAYRLRLLAILFESLVQETLRPEDLTEDWIAEVLSRCRLSEAALRTYTQRAFGPRTVLPSEPAMDDRARQLGATVLDPKTLSKGQRAALERVLESSRQFVALRRQSDERVHATQPFQQRAVSFYATLAKKILGRPVRVSLVRKPPDAEGHVESATFTAPGDAGTCELRINVEGKMDLGDPMAPESLGILFHELAHATVREHDLTFIARLEEVAGRGAYILAHEGRQLAESCGVPWRRRTGEVADRVQPGDDERREKGATHWNTPAPTPVASLVPKEGGG